MIEIEVVTSSEAMYPVSGIGKVQLCLLKMITVKNDYS
jgi:hypothetical protein